MDIGEILPVGRPHADPLCITLDTLWGASVLLRSFPQSLTFRNPQLEDTHAENKSTYAQPISLEPDNVHPIFVRTSQSLSCQALTIRSLKVSALLKTWNL